MGIALQKVPVFEQGCFRNLMAKRRLDHTELCVI